MWVPTGYPHRPAGGICPQAPGLRPAFPKPPALEKETELNGRIFVFPSEHHGSDAGPPVPFYGWPGAGL